MFQYCHSERSVRSIATETKSRDLICAGAAMRLSILLFFITLSCAPTQQLPTNEIATVTNTLLISSSVGRFADAVAVSTDQFGNLYVLDRGAPSIIKFSPVGDSLGVISGFGRDHYQFDMPTDVDARLSNFLYVADYANHRIERYTKDFAYSATIERREAQGNDLRFGYPLRVAAAKSGIFYLIDGENKRVLKVRSDLTIDRIVGAYSNSSGTQAALTNPTDIVVDGNDNLIVQDGKRLVTFDPLSNVIKQRELPRTVHSLAARNDTLFALASSGNEHELWLFHSTSLMRLGVWRILSELPIMTQDIDVRHGIILLSRERAYRADVTVQIK